jgi:asparagine synthase (glutamine-hydrolysing)
MCGIAGFLDPDLSTTPGNLGATVSAMAEALSHRGPDGEGTWIDPAGGIALGHRRLAILDLTEAGQQPMVSADERYVVVLNGEIYNFRRLREELEAKGDRFRGHSDTEVLLAAIVRWGLNRALPRLNGMFAFGLWDRRERVLSLVRDRLGEKPLYYGWVGRRFLFGSELKALRACAGPDLRVDRDAICALVRYKYVPAPRSIYEGIRKLPPACVLQIHASDVGRLPEPVPFWSAREAAEQGVGTPLVEPLSDSVDRVHELLRDSVRIRMESDVPIGAFLSGGVDSSTVAAVMQESAGHPIRTFTVAFEERSFDEATHAAAVAAHLGTDHTEVRVTAREALDVIPDLPRLFDEPFSDSSQIPTHLISAVARRHVTVALSGDGGDEVFGGYNRHAWLSMIWRRVGWMPSPVRRASGAALRRVPPGTWDAAFGGAGRLVPHRFRQRNPGDKLHKLGEMLTAKDPNRMYLAAVSHWQDPTALVLGSEEPYALAADPVRWPALGGLTQTTMYLDAVTYLPDDILTKVDRASMGVGLEARVPLLDHRLFELAWRLPLSLKIRDGESKWILRRVLDRYVPRAMIDRPKMGFGIPLGDWLRGPLRDWAESLLDESRLRAEGIFDPTPIRLSWEDHLAGRRNAQYLLWDVLMIQAWLESAHRVAPAQVPAR